MKLDDALVDDAKGKLTDDGDTFDLPDGRTIRLHVKPDDHSLLAEQGEGVWCGRIEWDSGRLNDYGYRSRPDGFDGRAEVIQRDHGYRLWWQVPSDVPIGSDVHRSLRSTIGEILEYGYSGFILHLLAPEDQADAVGHRPVLATASLWGIEPLPDSDYRESVIHDLIDELEEESDAD